VNKGVEDKKERNKCERKNKREIRDKEGQEIRFTGRK
jgi:hypothetical protein